MTLDLKAIRARCDAATRLSDPCRHVGCHSHLTHPCEGCVRQGGFASWESLLNMARTDLPTCVREIERLQKAVEASKMCLGDIEGCDAPGPCQKCGAWGYPHGVQKALE